jgi:drug/metabolite transporter, DME family
MPTSTFCLVMSGVLWGTGGLIGALFGQAAGISAMSVAAYRLLAGGGLIVIFLMLTGKRWPAGRAAWTRIAIDGLLSAIFQSCYFAAISLTSVSLATLVTIGATPVIVAIAEQAGGRRALDRAGVITIAVALAGLGLLVGLPGGGFSETAMLASTGMALLAAAGFAAVTLIAASPSTGLDELALNGFGFSLGGMVLLPLAAMTGGLGFRPGLASAGLLIALGIGPTALAYTLYFRGLRKAPASTGALLTLIEPLTAAVLAALVLGNRLSATGIAGAAMLLAAVVRTVRGHPASGANNPLRGADVQSSPRADSVEPSYTTSHPAVLPPADEKESL